MLPRYGGVDDVLSTILGIHLHHDRQAEVGGLVPIRGEGGTKSSVGGERKPLPSGGIQDQAHRPGG